MESIRILLIDKTTRTKTALEKAPFGRAAGNLDVTLMRLKNGNGIPDPDVGCDVVLIGEKLPRRRIIEQSGRLRARGITCPILLLTRESEARLQPDYVEAGVDDLLNIADISTPLFSWTFTSTIQQIVERRKAAEYDYLRDRLRAIKRSISTLIHDLNNPLSVIRLAVYHLEHSNPSKKKRDLYHSLMVENVERIEGKLKELYHIRRLLRVEKPVR